MNVYVDSSFVVSLYLTDIHSSEARRRIVEVSNVTLTPLHSAEWAHAIAQHEFRGNISREKARAMDSEFVADQKKGRWLEIAVPDQAFHLCAELARRHGSKLGMRALDSLHVACALELKAVQFWTFDERQKSLAKAERLTTN